MVSKGIASVTLWIGNKSFKVNFKIMPLPQQVDAILGMEFFNQYHVWLNPENKRLLIVDTDASTFDVLTSILNDAENDDANIHMDSATRAHFKKKKKNSAPSSHDKRSEVPHGKIHTSKDGLSIKMESNAFYNYSDTTFTVSVVSSFWSFHLEQ
eukprot:SAG31_NODE_6072_length_2182_cov_6.545847_2_plen_154_part_00